LEPAGKVLNVLQKQRRKLLNPARGGAEDFTWITSYKTAVFAIYKAYSAFLYRSLLCYTFPKQKCNERCFHGE